jgi:hypothetical protein
VGAALAATPPGVVVQRAGAKVVFTRCVRDDRNSGSSTLFVVAEAVSRAGPISPYASEAQASYFAGQLDLLGSGLVGYHVTLTAPALHHFSAEIMLAAARAWGEKVALHGGLGYLALDRGPTGALHFHGSVYVPADLDRRRLRAWWRDLPLWREHKPSYWAHDDGKPGKKWCRAVTGLADLGRHVVHDLARPVLHLPPLDRRVVVFGGSAVAEAWARALRYPSVVAAARRGRRCLWCSAPLDGLRRRARCCSRGCKERSARALRRAVRDAGPDGERLAKVVDRLEADHGLSRREAIRAGRVRVIAEAAGEELPTGWEDAELRCRCGMPRAARVDARTCGAPECVSEERARRRRLRRRLSRPMRDNGNTDTKESPPCTDRSATTTAAPPGRRPAAATSRSTRPRAPTRAPSRPRSPGTSTAPATPRPGTS